MRPFYKRLFFLLLFLSALPYYINLPLIPSLHTIMGFLALFLLIIVIIKVFRQEVQLKIDRTFFWVTVNFFASQSLSVIPALYATAFIGIYKYFILAMFFLVISFVFIQKQKDVEKIINIFLLVAGVNAIFQFIAVISPNLFQQLGSYIFDVNSYDMLVANVFRGRVPIQTFDEIVIPLIFYKLTSTKKQHRKYLYILLAAICAFSFLSGFRTKILMLIFSTIGSIYIFRHQYKKYIPLLAALSFTVVIVYTIVSLSLLNYYNTGIDRLLDAPNKINQLTSGRLESWNQAMNIGLSSPIFGVGLGNYIDYVGQQKKYFLTIFESKKILTYTASLDPHNILFSTFAETGIIGLIGYILLLFYFLRRDLYLLRSGNNLAKSFIVSFWTLFSFSLLNPSYLFTFQILFWLSRVLIEKTASLTGKGIQAI